MKRHMILVHLFMQIIAISCIMTSKEEHTIISENFYTLVR